MKSNKQYIYLPINEVIPEIKEKLKSENTLIVNAPAGAGKSTLLPLALTDEPWLKHKKIIMLEPRRLAARTIAKRMADLLNEKVGESIGYRIRFDSKISEQTRIEVVTEGILTRMLHTDNDLSDVGMIIFDEFHERSIFADIALALSRQTQEILRNDLRIMIMSATLDTPQLSQLLNASTIISQGRQFPVEVIYTDNRDELMIAELTTITVIRATKEQKGDILVFLPGEAEIKKCQDILTKELPNVSIHPLYGMLPQNKQYAAIMPNLEGMRKVVLSTSIAETSLTIEGITTVVDTGYKRVAQFDTRSGLSRLQTIEITKDSADQRAGRAGRLAPGVCYRMWNKATHAKMHNHRIPEILEADLTSLMLDLACWGITNINELTWLTTPPKSSIENAKKTLHELQALENSVVTQHGKEMNQLPCHPRIAHMLISAKRENSLGLATDIAALLQERDPLNEEAGIDLNIRIEALRRHRKGITQKKSLKRIERVAQSYRKLFCIAADDDIVDPYETGFLLVHAYPERIAHACPGNNAPFKLANGSIAKAGHKDDLAHESWLAIAHMNNRDNGGRIFLASPLNPRDLKHLVKQTTTTKWDNDLEKVVSNIELRIGSIILQSKPSPNICPDQIIEVICREIEKRGKQLLKFTPEVIMWQNRILSLRKWDSNNSWPDVSTDKLLLSCRDWLSPYLTNIRKADELVKLDLKLILHNSLTWQQQKLLNQLAPERIEVPSGSKIKLEYNEKGNAPILAVRIQEVFGLLKTPLICNHKIGVLIHLLSPASRPIQITSDLNSFWNNTYHEVRKELRIKYSKHYWPEDPFKAEAINGVRKKK